MNHFANSALAPALQDDDYIDDGETEWKTDNFDDSVFASASASSLALEQGGGGGNEGSGAVVARPAGGGGRGGEEEQQEDGDEDEDGSEDEEDDDVKYDVRAGSLQPLPVCVSMLNGRS